MRHPHHPSPLPASTALTRVRRLAAALACLGPIVASAQTAPPMPEPEGPPTQEPVTPAPAPTPAQDSPAAVSARAAAAATLSNTGQTGAGAPAGPVLGPLPAVVTVLGSGTSGGGTRALKAPAACTPKTNSLDCVSESGQSGQGANVSSRVRNSVIGEVGAGRSTTQGAGAAKREGPCTPQAGKLTCE